MCSHSGTPHARAQVYLHRILLQPQNRSGDVAKQVLQTLSIIVQNVRSERGVSFVFSNNHINNIVDVAFDFEEEEVLGFYICQVGRCDSRLRPFELRVVWRGVGGGKSSWWAE